MVDKVPHRETFIDRATGLLSNYAVNWLEDLIRPLNLLIGGVRSGQGSPEGVVTAPVGTIYRRLDGTPALWVKETGANTDTGWSSK